MSTATLARRLAGLTRALIRDLADLRFAAPVTHVYNPLVYARLGWDLYLERLARVQPDAILLGMNPGPWGMAQTGVPFGDPPLVRDWLGIEATVGKPDPEHPRRPVLGFASPRREVSGRRLWGWAADRFGTPERLRERLFVANYCPLCFMEEGGRNRTPDKLPAAEREALFAACDRGLERLVDAIQPRAVIGIGGFAEERARRLSGSSLPIGRILHPSPASPAANRDWAGTVTRQLADLGVRVDP